MTQAVLRIDTLPTAALEAAAAFHARHVARATDALGEADALAIVLPPAPSNHDDWRRAAARDLARAHTPKRVNIVAGDDEAAIAATLDYLERAPGVTGHYLQVDGQGADNPAG